MMNIEYKPWGINTDPTLVTVCFPRETEVDTQSSKTMALDNLMEFNSLEQFSVEVKAGCPRI